MAEINKEEYQILFNGPYFKNNKVILWDFNFYNITDEKIWWHFFLVILKLAKNEDLTLILIPQLELHLYFNMNTSIEVL